MKQRLGLTRSVRWLVPMVAVGAFGKVQTAGAQDAAALLRQSGIQGGLVVHVGCGDGSLTAALRVSDAFVVHGLDTDAAQVAATRKRLVAAGQYGPVSVDVWDGERLPYADNLVNLVIASKPERLSRQELLRVLAPDGVALVRRGDRFERVVKPRPDSIDEWTHYLHGPDGNPVAHDEAVGPPRHLQWIGFPRWSRHHDHMASLTSMVSAGGRLFYIIDEGLRSSIQMPSEWRLVARDAFNGIILWKRDIPQWNTRQYPLKSGPAHLLRRLVAVGDRVYATLGIDAPVSVLDAATGKTLKTLPGSEHTREIVVADGTAFLVADNGPSKLPDWRRVSTYVWANTRKANPDWGWHGEKRRVLAYDVGAGRKVWQVDYPVAPCSLAADGQRVVFHDGEKLISLDRRTGAEQWRGDPTPTPIPVQTNTGPRIVLYQDVVLLAPNNGKISGWSAADGKKLWEQKQYPGGHLSLKDLLVADGLVWSGEVASGSMSGDFYGYDPHTGKVARKFPADVKLHWFHHRCYPMKATDRYILASRNGTEYVDLRTEHWTPNHWVRGGCIYGVMPSNGITYAPMDACGCQLEAKLEGLKALTAAAVPVIDPATLTGEARLEKGPAYSDADGPPASATDWPTYRADEARSGVSAATVTANLGASWQVQLGARLTPPVVAAGLVFVADTSNHTLHAVDADSGARRWSFTAGGRIDSPPTYYRGRVLFGSADGYVYALRARDGQLAWRFRAAPLDRRHMAWEQLESQWPVHGSVLVHDGVLYCTAGRSIYLDGGIRMIRLDAATGKLLGEVVWDDKDPISGKSMHEAYLKKTRGNNMPVGLSDILSCDGRYIWMKSQKIDFEGRRHELECKDVYDQDPDEFHLFCQVGMLDDDYFFRSYWTFGRRMSGGYGSWMTAGRLVPTGRILCVDDERVYGYGREPIYMVNASVQENQLFAADRRVTAEALERVRKANGKINSRSRERNANSSDWRLRYFFPMEDLSAARFQWTVKQPAVIARALAVAGDTLFTAGPPKIVDERQAYHLPDDPDIQAKIRRQAEAYRGRRGGQLWALDKRTGRVLARYAIDTIPVFDGLASANGRLYLSAVNGRLLCVSPQAAKRLPSLDDAPLQIRWDQPEDPNYLLPPPEPRDKDFAKLVRCRVFSSSLGYRVRANAAKQSGLALKQLDKTLTGVITLKSRIRAAPDQKGLLSNGYIAFGASADPAQLVQCGVRLRARQAVVVRGDVVALKDAKTSPLKVPQNRPISLTVTVDLNSHQLTFAADKVRLTAPLSPDLKSISYVGYAVDSAIIDMAPIEVSQASG